MEQIHNFSYYFGIQNHIELIKFSASCETEQYKVIKLKKKCYQKTLVQNVLHMHMHICLKVKYGFREVGNLVLSYIYKNNIEGQNITGEGSSKWQHR